MFSHKLRSNFKNKFHQTIKSIESVLFKGYYPTKAITQCETVAWPIKPQD